MIEDINLLRVLIESDKNRKLTAFMLYYFWQNDTENIKEYLTEYATKDGMFRASSAKLLPKVHRDIVNKVLNNLCTTYHSGVDRYLVDDNGDVNEDQTELLNQIYKDAGITQAQKDWYKAGKLFNCVEVKPVWRNVTQKLEFDVWTPNWFSVWENAESKYIKDLILFDLTLIDANGVEREVREVWTENEHYYLVDSKSKFKVTIDGVLKELHIPVKEAIPGNEGMLNPYKDETGKGIIPSVTLRFKKGEDYYGIGMTGLVEDNIWHDIDISNQKWVKTLQGMGITYAVNTGITGTADITPNSIITVNDVKAEDETPFIDSVATNAPISELDASSKQNIDDILAMNGLSGQSATNKDSVKSGVSKAFDMEELEILRLDDKDILKDFEERLYEVVKTVYNYRTSGTKLADNLQFRCDFIERVTPLNEADKIAKWTFELNEGLSSKVDYLLSENPDLTTAEAEQILIQNEEYKTKFKSETTSTNTSGNDPVNQTDNSGQGLNQ